MPPNGLVALLVCALQSIRCDCLRCSVAAAVRPLRVGLSFRVFRSAKVSPYCFSDPAMPLVLSFGYAVFPRQT